MSLAICLMTCYGIQIVYSVDKSMDVTESWVRNLPGDVTLSDMVIPGTYDSLSFYSSSCVAINCWIVEKMCGDWKSSQPGSLYDQLMAGYRYLDIHINIDQDHQTSTLFEIGWKEIYKFAVSHPKEVIIIGFKSVNSDVLCRIVEDSYRVLEPQMLSSNFNSESTLQDIWTSKRNILVTVWSTNPTAPFICDKTMNAVTVHDITSSRKEQTKLFGDISNALSQLRQSKSHDLKMINLVSELSPLNLIGSLFRSSFMRFILFIVVLLFFHIGFYLANKDSRIFLAKRRQIILHRQYVVTATTALCLLFSYICICSIESWLGFYGIGGNLNEHLAIANTQGLRLLDGSHFKLQASSIEKGGINEMLYFWMTHPTKFRANILTVGNFETSELVNVAVSFNTRQIKSRFYIFHVGSPTNGLGEWSILSYCPAIPVVYMLTSRDEGLVLDWGHLKPQEMKIFEEGEYPMDTTLTLCVGTAWNTWLHVHTTNIQNAIDISKDLYIRTTESKLGRGWVFVGKSEEYYGKTCSKFHPSKEIIASVSWTETNVIENSWENQALCNFKRVQKT